MSPIRFTPSLTRSLYHTFALTCSSSSFISYTLIYNHLSSFCALSHVSTPSFLHFFSWSDSLCPSDSLCLCVRKREMEETVCEREWVCKWFIALLRRLQPWCSLDYALFILWMAKRNLWQTMLPCSRSSSKAVCLVKGSELNSCSVILKFIEIWEPLRVCLY